MPTDWAYIAAIASAFSSILMLVSVLVLMRQVREQTRATHAQAFKTVYDILQADDVREARATVLGELREIDLANWSKDQISHAEKVCHTYDSVAIMIRHKMIPSSVVADSWGDSLRRTWTILAPLATQYRLQRNSNEFWDDFEWLAAQAENYRKRIYGD